MDKLYNTLLKAIRNKFLDYSYWQPKEVRKYFIVDCPIYPYRFGRRPNESIIDTPKQFYRGELSLGRVFEI